MIDTYIDTLDEKLINQIFNYLNTILRKEKWSSSSGWDQNLVLNSTNIATHLIEKNFLYESIKRCIETKLKFKFEDKDLDFNCSIYLWGNGSYITWHEDNIYPYNGTIYLNKEWDSNDGGIFLYKDNKNEKIFGIEPKFNLMIVNYAEEKNPHNLHCVTCILPNVTKKRITIQWRTTKIVGLNKNNLKYQ